MVVNRKLNNLLKKKYLILFTLFATNLVDQPTPEVTIGQGTLTGKVSPDGSILEYLGIPYATTSSNTRFQPPLPAPSWDGVFKATEETAFCPQKTIFGVKGVEDCLKINIYVPAKAKGPLPVMVFIHGGAFIFGSGGKFGYGPEFLVRQNIILVTFNYRLGPLGFLCLGIKEAPGNAGLIDQVEALKWVNKNIAAFGGDPDNVTLFGQSAGGTSVSILLATEAVDKLVNKAIVQSGSGLSHWAINRRPIRTASLLAKALGYDIQDPHRLYELFLKTSFKELVKATVRKPFELFSETELVYLPCVENNSSNREPLLTDIPYNLLIKKSKSIPIMQGTTSGEGIFFINLDSETELQKRNERYLFATDLEFETQTELEVIAKKVKKFYYGDEVANMNSIRNVSNYYTHVYFEIPTILESDIYLEKSQHNVYNYYFNYDGGRNFMKMLSGFNYAAGACHGDDLLYIFNAKFWPFWINENDRKVLDFMTQAWTDFAKYGNPTPQPISKGDLLVNWSPSSKGNLKFLYIEDAIKMGTMPNPEAYSLWKNIYSMYRRKEESHASTNI